MWFLAKVADGAARRLRSEYANEPPLDIGGIYVAAATTLRSERFVLDRELVWARRQFAMQAGCYDDRRGTP